MQTPPPADSPAEPSKGRTAEGTNRNEELLDLLQGVSHAGVGLRRWGEDLNEDMEVIVEVEVLGFSAFPQLFFLKKDKRVEECVTRRKEKDDKNCPELLRHMIVTKESPNGKLRLLRKKV